MNINAKNCWEYWECSEAVLKECPIYQLNEGYDCWAATNAFVKYFKNGSAHKKYENCSDCPWFKLRNSGFENN